MRISGHVIIASVLGLCVGLAGGAVGALALYQGAYGNPAELWAGRAAEYGAMLYASPNEARPAELVVEQVRHGADQATLTAAMGYDTLRAVYRKNLRSAAVAMQAHSPAVTENDDVIAQYAAAARTCIASNADAPATVAGCTRDATAAIRARYCTNGACAFPGMEPMAAVSPE